MKIKQCTYAKFYGGADFNCFGAIIMSAGYPLMQTLPETLLFRSFVSFCNACRIYEFYVLELRRYVVYILLTSLRNEAQMYQWVE